jgi:hypothetical protein
MHRAKCSVPGSTGQPDAAVQQAVPVRNRSLFIRLVARRITGRRAGESATRTSSLHDAYENIHQHILSMDSHSKFQCKPTINLW